jgi:hypothetical protein
MKGKRKSSESSRANTNRDIGALLLPWDGPSLRSNCSRVRRLIVALAALAVFAAGVAQGQSPLQNAELILVGPKVVANQGKNERYNDGVEFGCQGIAKLFKNSDGTWTLTANYVGTGQGLVSAGERCSNDVVLNNLIALINKVHGQQLLPTTTQFVDMLIPSRLRVDPIPGDGIAPQSVLLLTSDFRIVEIKGIWGTGGVAFTGIWGTGGVATPRPEHIQIHGPLWNDPAHGVATRLTEGSREFDVPLAGFDEPLIAVGTSTGRVGLAGFDEPALGFDEPALGFENPIISLGQPFLFNDPFLFDEPALGFGPVKGLALMETESEGHYLLAALIHDAVSGPRVLGIDLGVGATGELRELGKYHAQLPKVVFSGAAVVDGVALESIASGRLGTDTNIISPGPPPILLSSALVAVDGSANLQFHTLARDPVLLVSFDEPALGLVAPGGNPVQLSRIWAGSLTAVSTDGQTGLYMPLATIGGFSPSTGPISVLGGVHSVDIGPQGFNLRAGGQYFTVRIEADGQSAAGILDSVRLSVDGVPGSIMRSSQFTPQLADLDADGNLELVLKFDRSAVASLLAVVGVGNSASVVLQWDYDDQFTTGSSIHTVRVVN